MACWECYFDESGCDDYSRVLAVGGYLIRSDNARAMEIEWQVALEKAGVQYLHMVDLAHGNDIYKDLEKNVRIQLGIDCISIIKKYVSFGICLILNPKRFASVDAYDFACNNCVGAIAKWLKNRDIDSDLSVFFESGHASQSSAEKHLRSNLERFGLLAKGKGSLKFTDCLKAKLLQAADLFAWQVTKNVKDKLSKKRSQRKDFLELCEKPHLHVLLYLIDDPETNGLSVSQQSDPKARNDMQDAYLRAMFGAGEDADEMLKVQHAWWDARGALDIFPKS